MDSELVFLLILVLTVVINIVKAINKKKQPSGQGSAQKPTTAPPVTPAGSDWQSVLRELLGESPAPAKPTPQEFSEEAESIETLEPLGGYINGNNTYNFEEPNYTKSSLSDTTEPFDVQPSTTSVPANSTHHLVSSRHDYWDELRRFDLRKAVIYSAILNRPYA